MEIQFKWIMNTSSDLPAFFLTLSQACEKLKINGTEPYILTVVKTIVVELKKCVDTRMDEQLKQMNEILRREQGE